MRQSVFASQFKAIYESIHLDCVMPINRFDVFSGWPQSLRLPMKIHTTAENSGVILTESILMLLFRNQLFPIELEQAFANQCRRCKQRFIIANLFLPSVVCILVDYFFRPMLV